MDKMDRYELLRLQARIAQLEAALIEALDTGRLDTHEKYQRLCDIAYPQSETVAEPEHHHQWVEACAGTSVAYFTCATCGAFFDGSPKKTK